MQQLIKNGANPDIVLGLEMNILFDWNQGTYGNNSSLNKLTFLCAQGGFDQKVLNTLKDKREILDCLIQQLEKNQTLRDIKIDEK